MGLKLWFPIWTFRSECMHARAREGCIWYDLFQTKPGFLLIHHRFWNPNKSGKQRSESTSIFFESVLNKRSGLISNIYELGFKCIVCAEGGNSNLKERSEKKKGEKRKRKGKEYSFSHSIFFACEYFSSQIMMTLHVSIGMPCLSCMHSIYSYTPYICLPATQGDQNQNNSYKRPHSITFWRQNNSLN